MALKVQNTNLVYSPHPILAAKDRQIISIPFLPGETINEYLERIGLRNKIVPGLVLLSLNGQVIPTDRWNFVCPREGDLLVIRGIVRGGGDNSKNPIATVLTIALVVAVTILTRNPAFISAVQGYQTLAAGAIFFAGTLLINHLFPPPKPDLSLPGGLGGISPTYDVSGGQNRARPYQPAPIVVGQHIIFPDMIAKPYTVFQGNSQYLYQLFGFGLQTMAVSDVIDLNIGNTALGNFGGVQKEWDVSGDGSQTLFPTNVDSITGGGVLAVGDDYVSRTTSIDTNQIQIDIVAVLFTINKGNGNLEYLTANFDVDYRTYPDGDWQTLVNPLSLSITLSWTKVLAGYRTIVTFFGLNNYDPVYEWRLGTYDFTTTGFREGDLITISGFTYTENNGTFKIRKLTNSYLTLSRSYPNPQPLVGSGLEPITETASATITIAQVYDFVIKSNDRTPIRRTINISVTKGQYDVRVRVNNISGQRGSDVDTKEINWTQMRSFQPDETNYYGQNIFALIIKASEQLSGTVDELNAVVYGKCEVWNGSVWVEQTTSNPAWWFRHIAKGKTDSNVGLLYGAGITDSGLDLDAIKDWGVWCDTKSLECNLVFDQKTTLFDMLSVIARCGRASVTWGTGKLGVIWEEKSQPVVQVFNVANILRGSFGIQYITGNLAEEVELQFINKDLNWQRDTIRKKVIGAPSNPTRVVSVELLGITNYEQAGKEANLMAARQYYHRKKIKWKTDIEGLVCHSGDIVQVQHDMPGWDNGGRIRSGGPIQFQLNSPVTFTSGLTHYLTLRHPNGDIETKTLYDRVNGDTTNYARQTDMDGTVAGVLTGVGSLPTGWTGSITSQSWVTVTGYGSEYGLYFIEFMLNGTAGSATFGQIKPYTSVSQNVPVDFGDYFAASCFFKYISGSWVGTPQASDPLFIEARNEISDSTYLGHITTYAQETGDMEYLTAKYSGQQNGTYGEFQFFVDGQVDWFDYRFRLYSPQVEAIDSDGVANPIIINKTQSSITQTVNDKVTATSVFSQSPSQLSDPTVWDYGGTTWDSGATDFDGRLSTIDWLWQFADDSIPGEKVKITDIQPESETEITITAIPEVDAYYDAEDLSYDYSAPNIFGVTPPSIDNIIIGEELIRSGDTFQVRIFLQWDITGGDYHRAIIMAGNADDELHQVASTYNSEASFAWQPTGQLYIQVRATTSRNKSTESGTKSFVYTIAGLAAPPPDVDVFSVARQPDGTRQFDWKLIYEPSDLAGYKIKARQGNWNDWDDLYTIHTGLLNHSPWETNQLSGGTYTAAIKAVDTSGNESDNATFISATLLDPRIPNALTFFEFSEYLWLPSNNPDWASKTERFCYVDTVDNKITSNSVYLWNARTQYDVSTDMSGVTTGVLGSGGVLPTGWTYSHTGSPASGPIWTINSTGQEYGLYYIDTSLSVSNAGGAGIVYVYLGPFNSNRCPVTSGNSATSQVLIKYISSTAKPSAAGAIKHSLRDYPTSSGGSAITTTENLYSTATTLQYSDLTKAVGANRYFDNILMFTLQIDDVFTDFRFRIYSPNLEALANAYPIIINDTSSPSVKALSSWSSYSPTWVKESTPIMFWIAEDLDVGADAKFQPISQLFNLENVSSYEIDYDWTTLAGSYNGYWTAQINLGVITARFVKVRVTLWPDDNTRPIRFGGLQFIASAETIIEEKEDLDTSTLTDVSGGVRLPLVESFVAITNVTLVFQTISSSDMPVSYSVEDKNPTSGPLVKMYTNAGTTFKPVVDAIIRGI